jgi:hypothetical protein
VDAKTVERWITRGRVPYRKHRFDVAMFLGVDEAYTWPDALGRDEVAAVSRSEVVAVWPHRWAVPRDTWGLFFAKAEREIGALVYSGMFMAEDIGVRRLFAERPGPESGSDCFWVTRTAPTWPSAVPPRDRRDHGGEGRHLDRAVPEAAGPAGCGAAAAWHRPVQLEPQHRPHRTLADAAPLCPLPRPITDPERLAHPRCPQTRPTRRHPP